MSDDQRKAFAAICHRQWANWMRYLFSVGTPDGGGVFLPPTSVERWRRQMETDYEDLSAGEQASDLRLADEFLAALIDQESRYMERMERFAKAREKEREAAQKKIQALQEGAKRAEDLLRDLEQKG